MSTGSRATVIGLGAAFDVAVKVPGRTMTLRYETTAFDTERRR